MMQRQAWVPKQPQLLQEAEPAAALPQPLVGKGDPQGTFEKRQQGKSHERSFWKAWFHIAMWREQEVDALKEGKAKVFHHRRSMTIMFRSWDITTAESRGRGIFCNCFDMWLNGPAAWEDHKIGKKHKKKSRRPPYAETFSTASSIGHETSSLQHQSALSAVPHTSGRDAIPSSCSQSPAADTGGRLLSAADTG